jgi:hypothetical protein
MFKLTSECQNHNIYKGSNFVKALGLTVLLSGCASTDTGVTSTHDTSGGDSAASVLGALFTGMALGASGTNVGSTLSALGSAFTAAGAASTSDTTSSPVAPLPAGAPGQQIVDNAVATTLAGVGANASTDEDRSGNRPSLMSAQSSISSGGSSAETFSESGSNCPATLAHLDNQLPKYDLPILQKGRSMVLKEDLRASFQKAIGSGRSPAQAATEMLRSASEAERTKDQAKSCIKQVSTDYDGVIYRLEKGTYDMRSGTIQQSCAANYVLMHYLAVGSKETAIAFACMAQR